MLTLRRLPPLAEILQAADQLTAEQKVELETTLRTLIVLQEWIDIGIGATSDIYLPPHERLMLYQIHRGAPTTIMEASRGTSKSAVACVLYPIYTGMVIPRRNAVLLSATGFRGGQAMMLDGEKWLNGQWDSQHQEAAFIRDSYPRSPSPIHKAAGQWTMTSASGSSYLTLPTKDENKVRGTRGHILIEDEASTMEKRLIEVAEPFLNVGRDMRHGGAYADNNQVVMVSTIDYSWRPFQEKIRAARAGLERDRLARIALDKGDTQQYEALRREKLNQYSYVKFDYTDLLIRKQVRARDGVLWEVTHWPDAEIPLLEDEHGIPFTMRGEDGRMLLEGDPVQYWPTYSVQKGKIEEGLFDGSTDQASWLSEQRNILDTATGDVYSNELIARAACEGDNVVTPYAKLPERWQKAVDKDDDDADYVAPVLWTCNDPCVLGVDYAPLSDFSAFVVMRVGPLATGEFDPFLHTGHTPWSSVIWAEQHQKMTARQVADKIRMLRSRYNLVWHHEPHKQDPWEVCRGIGLDMRGGGTAVRDELCWINESSVPAGEYRLYDPLDKDEKIVAFEKDALSIPILDTIWPTDTLNDRLVEWTKGQLETKFLYIGKFRKPHERETGNRELHVGYEAMRILCMQLRKIRQEPTQAARRFYMEGDRAQDRNKKDLFSAFLYCGKQVRSHLIRYRQILNTPPPMGAVMHRPPSRFVGGTHGRVPGTR